jgi:hypothetical protein
MEYGGPYWQLFSSHLTKEDYAKLQRMYPHITFPPVWPHPPSDELGTLNYKDIGRAEWDYAVASKNLYDVLDDEEVPSGQVNPRVAEHDDASVVAHQEHPRINSMSEQRLIQQSLTYHRGIHVRLQGWKEGHATGTEWDPILVVTKVMAELAEDEGNHVPKLSAYQIRKGVIDFILRRFSLNEIERGQAGEALQQVVKHVSQPYSDRMKSAFPKEVEQDIITKLIMRCCQTIPDTPYASIVHPDVTLFMLTQERLQNEWHHIIRRWRRIYEVLYIQKEKLDLWTTIPKQYTVTVLIEDSALRYTSWFWAGSLQKSQTVAPPAAKVSHPPEPLPDIRRHQGRLKQRGGRAADRQYKDQNTRVRTGSARGQRRLQNTEGHNAKKARKTQAISGSPVNGRSSDISTKVRRNSLQSPSTDGRSLSCSQQQP